MISRVPAGGRLPLGEIALALGVWAISGASARAGEDGVVYEGRSRWERKSGLGHLGRRKTGCGTLGYGPPGLHPGFQGFGLGYHPGYGYGGDALGVGAEGGYPFYGGPGYPHPSPRLQRFGGINPF